MYRLLLNSLFGFCILASSLIAVSHADQLPLTDSDVDYGELYVIQKMPETDKKWEANITYGYGFSNPYLGIHTVQITTSRRLGEYFRIGFSPIAHFATTKAFTKALNDNLLDANINTEIYHPKYSAIMNFDLIPLSGMINFFNSSSLQFDMIVGFGTGFTKYVGYNRMLPTALIRIMPQFMISKTVGTNFGLQSYYDRFPGGSWQNRLEASIGVITKF